jgi:hypothetical protein
MSVLGRGKRAAVRVLLCSPRWEMCCFNITSAARTAPTEAWPGIALLLLVLQENGRRCEVTSNCALILRLLVSSHAWSRRLCSPHPAAGATMPVKLLLTAASLPRGGRSCNALTVGLNDETRPSLALALGNDDAMEWEERTELGARCWRADPEVTSHFLAFCIPWQSAQRPVWGIRAGRLRLT